jgi:hypothetical protein
MAESQVAGAPALLAARSWASQRTAGLSASERGLHGRILRAFADGVAPAPAQLAAWAAQERLDLDDALTALEANDLVQRDGDTGRVSVAYPFSAAPTAHRVRVSSGVEVFAMCALDALGVAFMLGAPTHVTSLDPRTGERIEVAVDLAGASAWSPPAAVVAVGCAGGGTSAACMCPHTNFAASPEHGQALLDATPGCSGGVLSMPDAIAVGRDLFGTLLAANDHGGPDAQADRA